MRSPYVSVVLAVYNDAPYLAHAIESILIQTFSNFEFIVVDDGSTDDTSQIIERYANRDTRICSFRQENQGVVSALKRGIEAAQGEIIARMDGDDISLPRRLEVLTAPLLNDQSIVLAGGNCELIDEYGKHIGIRNINTNYANEYIKKRMIFQGGDIAFRKEVYKCVGGYRSGFRYAQDYDLVLRIAEQGTIVKLSEVTYKLRITVDTPSFARRKQQSILANYARKFREERARIGQDSYNEMFPLLKAIANDPHKDMDYGKVWIAFVKMRDLGKIEARDDLLQIVKKGSVRKWRALAAILLCTPEFLVQFFIRVRQKRLEL
jgi:glycosyltransferase involved in cell wall biosynthesis